MPSDSVQQYATMRTKPAFLQIKPYINTSAYLSTGWEGQNILK